MLIQKTEVKKPLLEENLKYTLQANGDVMIPLVGKVNLKGMTVFEAEETLAGLFNHTYKKPFVKMLVTNREGFCGWVQLKARLSRSTMKTQV